MRFQGKIKSWNKAKGFGFIYPNGSGNDVFAHISSFENRYSKPEIADIVTYEIEQDEKKRNRATKIKFVGEKNQQKSLNSVWGFLVPILLFILIGLIVRDLFQHRGSTIQSTFYKSVYERDYDSSNFSCQGKTHCSEMTSCQEALFYVENCSDTQMDGNHDSIPCEQQWCD